MWRCPKCETYNNEERCVVCNEEKVIYTYVPENDEPRDSSGNSQLSIISVVGVVFIGILIVLLVYLLNGM